jgi:hypothetical protein
MILIAHGCVEKSSTISLPANSTYENRPSSTTASISQQELFNKSYSELAHVVKSIQSEKNVMREFEHFIKIMKTYVNDYSTTIERSAYFSQAIRVLPIPYAGEVSNATRIVSNSLVTLNNTATALDRYQNSSQSFLNGFNQLGKKPSLVALDKLSRYADDILIVNALDLQANMREIGKTTENLLYINSIISETSSTASSFFGRLKDFITATPSKNEKDSLEESDDTFKSKLVQLNRHITILEKSATINRQSIARSRVYSNLAVEISLRSK